MLNASVVVVVACSVTDVVLLTRKKWENLALFENDEMLSAAKADQFLNLNS